MQVAVRIAVPVGLVRWNDRGRFSVVVKATYELASGNPAPLAAVHTRLSAGAKDGQGNVISPNDFVPSKVACDIALSGSVRARYEPARVRLGRFDEVIAPPSQTESADGSCVVPTQRVASPALPLEVWMETRGRSFASTIGSPVPAAALLTPSTGVLTPIALVPDTLVFDPVQALAIVTLRGKFEHEGDVDRDVVLVVDMMGRLSSTPPRELRKWPRQSAVEPIDLADPQDSDDNEDWNDDDDAEATGDDGDDDRPTTRPPPMRMIARTPSRTVPMRAASGTMRMPTQPPPLPLRTPPPPATIPPPPAIPSLSATPRPLSSAPPPGLAPQPTLMLDAEGELEPQPTLTMTVDEVPDLEEEVAELADEDIVALEDSVSISDAVTPMPELVPSMVDVPTPMADVPTPMLDTPTPMLEPQSTLEVSLGADLTKPLPFDLAAAEPPAPPKEKSRAFLPLHTQPLVVADLFANIPEGMMKALPFAPPPTRNRDPRRNSEEITRETQAVVATAPAPALPFAASTSPAPRRDIPPPTPSPFPFQPAPDQRPASRLAELATPRPGPTAPPVAALASYQKQAHAEQVDFAAARAKTDARAEASKANTGPRIEGVTLAEFTTVRKALWSGTKSKDEVLKSYGLTPLKWRLVERGWGREIDSASEKANHTAAAQLVASVRVVVEAPAEPIKPPVL